MKNPAGKTAKKPYERNAYEIWQSFDGTWNWFVLKKWQVDDTKEFARWFCLVKTPIVPEGELGDVYVAEIKNNARRVPDAVLQAIRDKFANENELEGVLSSLRYDGLNHCWYFHYAGMYHGVEDDGYIHT